MLRHRLATVFVAAFAAAAGAGAVSLTASARPAQVAPGDYQSLRQENAQLRSDLSYYQAAYSALDQGLTDVERVTRTIRDRRTVKYLTRVVRDARAQAAQYVGRDDQRGPGWDPRDPRDTRDTRDTPDTRETARILSAGEFNDLLARVNATGFDDSKLALIQSAAQYSVFSVAQVVDLMKSSNFDDTRIAIAATLRPRTVDLPRWYLVYDALQFESSKSTLRARVGE